MKAAFQTKHTLHRPGETIAAADADGLRVFEIGRREPSSAGNKLQV